MKFLKMFLALSVFVVAVLMALPATYIYSTLKKMTKANLKCDTCWDLKALKAFVK